MVVEFEATDSLVSSKEFIFPQDNSSLGINRGPKVYYSKHSDDGHTDPSHPDYTSKLSYSVTMSKSKIDKFKQKADDKMKEVYPSAIVNEIFYHVQPPTLGGHYIANTTSKYASKLHSKSDIEVNFVRFMMDYINHNKKNLYFTGRDLSTYGLAGDIQGGWTTANAILGINILHTFK